MAKKDMNVLFLHHARLEQMDKFMTNEEIGMLVRAAYKYDRFGEDTEFDDRALSMAFISLKNDADFNRKKYQDTCKKREEAVKKRWEKEQKEKCVEAPETVKALIEKAF